MGESRVINVTFRSTDPRFAAQFANGLAQAYVDQNLEMRRQGSLEASAWLNDRLAELRGQVTAREGALQQYREQQDAVSLDDRQNIVVQKLAQLNAAVTTARTDRVDKEALYQQLVAIQQKRRACRHVPGDHLEQFHPGPEGRARVAAARARAAVRTPRRSPSRHDQGEHRNRCRRTAVECGNGQGHRGRQERLQGRAGQRTRPACGARRSEA